MSQVPLHQRGALELLRDDAKMYSVPSLGHLLSQRYLEPVFPAQLVFLTGAAPPPPQVPGVMAAWGGGGTSSDPGVLTHSPLLLCLLCLLWGRRWIPGGPFLLLWTIIRPLDLDFSSPWRAPRHIPCHRVALSSLWAHPPGFFTQLCAPGGWAV